MSQIGGYLGVNSVVLTVAVTGFRPTAEAVTVRLLACHAKKFSVNVKFPLSSTALDDVSWNDIILSVRTVFELWTIALTRPSHVARVSLPSGGLPAPRNHYVKIPNGAIE